MIVNSDSRQWVDDLLLQGKKLQDENCLSRSSVSIPDKNSWLNNIRHQAKSAIEKMNMPAKKDEIWRYSNMDKLYSHHFTLANENFTAKDELELNENNLPESECYRIVLANGYCLSNLSNLERLSAQVTISSLQDALSLQSMTVSNSFGQVSEQEPHIFSALNMSLINDGVYIHIGAGIKLDKPIEIISINSGTRLPLMIQSRNLIVMGEGASAIIVERHVNNNHSLYFNNHLTEIILHDQASLKHYSIQDESKRAYHMDNIYVSQMAQSEYHNTTFSVGGYWARSNINIDLNEPMAQCNLNGLYSVGENQLIDFHTKVKHKAPDCACRENYKGVLYAKGRAVFDGHIVVNKDAQGTDAHMSNANLLLSRNAEIDTKPQLEIYADDVKCSHGTTVGQLEPEQIFYLRSRGIEESRAKQMLCYGFAAEIINTIDIKSLAENVSTQFQEQIQARKI